MKNKKKICFEIMAIILITIFGICLAPKTLQNDTFYTIKIGEHIVQNKGIDMKDPFSWHQNLDYTYPHWLYDVMIYTIYSIGGMAGIYISTCVFSAILGIVLYKVNSKLTSNKVLSFVITILAMYLLRDYIAARAQLVTFILFALQLYAMEKLANTSKKRYGIGLIFTFVLYLPYIAEYIFAIVEERIAKKYGKEVKEGTKITIKKREGTKYLIIVMIICAFTGLLTPLGTTPYTYLIKTMQGNTTQNINEHLPMTLINCVEILCTLIIFIILLTFTDVKIRLTDLFMLGGLIFLMLYSKRQSTMFIIMCSVILNRMTYEFMKKDGEKIDDNLINVCTTLFGGFVISALVLILGFHCAKGRVKEEYIDEKAYPVQMSDYILEYFDENNIDIKNVRLYNEYNYGSYLLYRGIPVFIDSRADLYSPEFNSGVNVFEDSESVGSFEMDIDEFVEKYNITHIILSNQSQLNKVLKKIEGTKYKLVKEDENFSFYKIENL